MVAPSVREQKQTPVQSVEFYLMFRNRIQAIEGFAHINALHVLVIPQRIRKVKHQAPPA